MCVPQGEIALLAIGDSFRITRPADTDTATDTDTHTDTGQD